MLVILRPVHFIDWLDASVQAAPAFVRARTAGLRWRSAVGGVRLH